MPTPFPSTASRPPDGPAVAFQPDLLRSWLAQPDPELGDRAEHLGVNELFSRAHGGLLSGLDELLAALAQDDAQAAWRLQPGVAHIGLFRTFDGDTCDGAIIVVDLDDRRRLASLHQEHRDFASMSSHSIDAAIQALDSLTATANTVMAHHLQATGIEQATSAGTMADVLNAVAEDILHLAISGDEGLRDAINLTVNAIPVYLQSGWRTADPDLARQRLEHVAADRYDTDLDTILDWIAAGV
jgi:hypothetical protein